MTGGGLGVCGRHPSFEIAAPAKQDSPHYWQFSKAQTDFWLSKLRTCMILLQNYAGSKQKSYKIMTMKMFTILDKAKPNTGNIRGLNLATVKHTTVQMFNCHSNR
jgi:hypothetical protein